MSSQQSGSGQRERDPGIDLLRGAAILGVVLFHLWGFTTGSFAFPARHSALLGEVGDRLQDFDLLSAFTVACELAFRSGRDGVSMFLILSGTALTMGALKSGIPKLPAFYVRRLGRLLRAYWAGFAVVAISLFLLAIVKTELDGRSLTYNWGHIGRATYFDRDQFLAGLTLIPRLFKLHWFFAPPNPLWFVALILQFYLVFPFIFRLAQRHGIVSVLIGSLAMSIASTAILLARYDANLGVNGWIITIWLPFRIFDFVIGMALGYVLVQHRELARRFATGLLPTFACVAGGVTVYLLGAVIDDGDGYYRAVSFPLVAAGLAVLAMPALFKLPGRVETSAVGRTLVWIGPMSIAVLIMNEPFRFVDHYLWFKGQTWTAGWWLYIVVLYVPGTLVTAAVLSRLLGLTPAGHPTQLLRDMLTARTSASTSEPALRQAPASD
jgi:peptidoglycan/LPS O-acetylase OafA/YrhL